MYATGIRIFGERRHEYCRLTPSECLGNKIYCLCCAISHTHLILTQAKHHRQFRLKRNGCWLRIRHNLVKTVRKVAEQSFMVKMIIDIRTEVDVYLLIYICIVSVSFKHKKSPLLTSHKGEG